MIRLCNKSRTVTEFVTILLPCHKQQILNMNRNQGSEAFLVCLLKNLFFGFTPVQQ